MPSDAAVYESSRTDFNIPYWNSTWQFLNKVKESADENFKSPSGKNKNKKIAMQLDHLGFRVRSDFPLVPFHISNPGISPGHSSKFLAFNTYGFQFLMHFTKQKIWELI